MFSSYNLITTNIPTVNVLRFGQLGIAVSNIVESISFYNKVGFTLTTNDINCNVVSLINRGNTL